ncbi:MAG: hypothetical protein U1E10_13760, partial [Bdellovibrionales bacterium]|nr:hypothetical protein [Bdellovibrionales bacterium]
MDRKLLTNHALTFSKYLVKYYLPAVVAIFLILETGLRLSHIFQPSQASASQVVTDTYHRILLVSDSILGTMTDTKDAAGKFVQKMTSIYKDKVSIAEL